jgi:hypothetical protein
MKLITKKIALLEQELTHVNGMRSAYDTNSARQAAVRAEADDLQARLDHAVEAAPEVINRDTMPAEVALEMLTDPKVRLTNRMRKNCLAARETHYASVSTRTPGAAKLAARLRTKKLTQLGNWLRRSVQRSRHTSRMLARIAGVPALEQLAQALMVRSLNLNISQATVEHELQSRGIPYFIAPERTREPLRKVVTPSAKPQGFFARVKRALGV